MDVKGISVDVKGNSVDVKGETCASFDKYRVPSDKCQVRFFSPSPGVDFRPAVWQSTGNIRRTFGGIFEMLCAEW